MYVSCMACMIGCLYNLYDFCMIAVSMGNLAQKKWIERLVPTQKDPIVIDGNRENPEKSCNSSGFTENGKRRSSKNLFFSAGETKFSNNQILFTVFQIETHKMKSTKVIID